VRGFKKECNKQTCATARKWELKNIILIEINLSECTNTNKIQEKVRSHK
jgi:hypothetical protein